MSSSGIHYPSLMCGIAGILKVWTPAERQLALRTPHGQSIPESWLDILDDSIKHRGPDGQGRFRDRAIRGDGCVVDVALVHRRLSIIDHAGGHQPMVWTHSTGILPVEDVQRYTARAASQDWSDAAARPMVEHRQNAGATDRIAVVFNGCIYNHRELRAELQRAGHVFSTDHSDTEVLVHGWREWGGSLPSKLDGMFSICLWNSQRGLVMARDHSGEKPLYYTDELPFRGIAFASTPTALARLMRGSSEKAFAADGALLAEWLRFGFGEATPSWDIQAVHPGSAFEYANQTESESHTFFATSSVPPDQILNVDRLDAMLDRAVVSRLDADVPMGCFLSGGVDSSLIASYAQRELLRSRGRLRTFTVRMPDVRFDESSFAAHAATVIGTEHTTLQASVRPTDDLNDLVSQSGVPLGDSSLLPAYWVSREARKHVSVVLGGDGADELFFGYERYTADKWLRRFGRVLAMVGLPGAARAHPKSRLAKLDRLARAARGLGYLDLLAIFSQEDLQRLLSPAAVARPWPPTRSGRLFDLEHYLPNDILCKTDTASMFVSLEVRSPFLSREVVAAAKMASESTLMPHGQRKGLLRQVARNYLPAEIIDRPKMGFAIPIGEWFRSDYGGLGTMLLDHLNSTEPFGPPSLGIDLNMKFIRQMLDEHLGTGPSGMVKRDHSQRLYMLLVLSIWAKWMGSLQ